MQIQRIQSLYLLLACAGVVVMMFMPVVKLVSPLDPTTALLVKPTGELALLIPVALTALMLLLDIFLYNNLALQRRVLMFSMMFTVLDACVIAFMVYNGVEGYESTGTIWIFLLVVSLFFEVMAKRGIDHDENLLRSADRLR